MLRWATACSIVLLAGNWDIPATDAVGTAAADTAASDALKEDIRLSLQTGEVGPNLQAVSQALSLAEVLLFGSDEAWGSNKGEKSVLFCSACNTAVGEVLNLVHHGANTDAIFNATVNICIALNISNAVFCEAMIEVAKPQLAWIFMNSDLTGRDVCGTVFVRADCQSNNPDRVWEIELPDVPKPPLVEHSIPKGAPTLKVLHLADTHFDPYYVPGSNAVCGERYLCCRAESGPLSHPTDAAGYWGDYRECDSPRWMLEQLYTHVMDTYPDLSFIIWTGDLVPHDIWNTTVEDNLYIIREAVKMVQEYFPGIPVFPAIGNHEAHPVNAFPQPYIDNEFDISWLYDELSTLWQTWLPEDVAQSVMYSAYYVTDVYPALRLLSVNTNYCYGYNWWLLYDSHDPGEVLEWMTSELQRAEDDGVWVYLISHIPSGHEDCGYTWSRQYNRIVARYEGSIAGIFYAHTHKDHFQVFFDPEDAERATKVGFVAQSQTTYHQLNPGYKVYTIDGGREGATYTVLDHENWYFDLDDANNQQSVTTTPKFQILYTAKDEYGLADLSAQSHYDLIKEMEQEGSHKFDLFFKNYIKDARPYMEEGCDADCKTSILCRLLVSDTSDRSICKTLN